MDIKELQSRMAKAIADNNVKDIEAIAQEIVKSKSERAKAEATAAVKEAEALAGVREALAKEIHKAVKSLNLNKKLLDVKSWGFTYKVDGANPAEPDIKYTAVSLSTQQIKAHKPGVGGGTGKTKDEFGMSLSEVFDKFATADDKAALAEAEAKDNATKEKTGKTNQGYQYAVKKEVKKRVLAAGLIAPVK